MFNYKEVETDSVEFIPIAKTEDLPENERIFVEVDDLAIVVVNIAGGYFAIGDFCSHDDGPLGEGEIEGYEVICPRHGARFDVRNGKANTLPAIVDIPAYPVRILGDQIEVGIPFED
jgi:3-phenylpropionate/trans-cinnamate dioxygenase ferredoxin subunit